MNNKIDIPFSRKATNGWPLIKVHFSPDKQFYALIDSGAECSIVDKSLVPERMFKGQEEEIRMVGIDKPVCKKVIRDKLVFCVDDVDDVPGEIFQEFIMLDDKEFFNSLANKTLNTAARCGMLLGADFLNALEATLDFKAGRLLIGKDNNWIFYVEPAES